jgi:hypothetical protein
VHPCTGTEALYSPYGKVQPCTGTEVLYRPYGKLHPCTGTEALYRPYGKVHPCTDTEALYRPYSKVHPCTGTEALYRSYGKVHPCTGRTAQRESRGIALPFLDHGTRRGEGSVSRHGRSLPRERPGTHCTEVCVGPRAGLDRCGKSLPHQDLILGPSSRGQSLYRLSYSGPDRIFNHHLIHKSEVKT